MFPLGQLQNQAYGYLFPQGLFFALLSWLPDWTVQRLWWGLLLALAFAGMVRLLEVAGHPTSSAGVGSPASRILAGVLYALSPRILTTLGAISSEAWVVALAPWVLIPVVLASQEGQRVRFRALSSAVAILCLGAINAVATATAVLPAVVWWCVWAVQTHMPRASRGQRSAVWRFGLWWAVGGLLACFWWIGPLLVLGKYSPPFTDFIESAGLTTRWLNPAEVLRGTTSWTPFLSPERVGGFSLVTEPVFIVSTLIVAFLGLRGLASRTMPHGRRWLVLALLGLAIMVLAVEPFSPAASPYRAFLDGPGAALRNLHKFDPLVRLALMAGAAHSLRSLRLPSQLSAAQWLRPEKNPQVVRSIAAILLVVLATAPGWSGRIAPADGYRSVPTYWAEAAQWLNAHAAGVGNKDHQIARTLILPKARFARQTWGNTRDEPAQPLLDVPWVVRDSVPLVQPDAIRALDGVQRELETGQAIPNLAATLWNQGIGQVVVRTDLTRSANTTGAKPILQTLEKSGGFDKVATFGEGQGGADGTGLDAIQIFTVRSPLASSSEGAGAGGAGSDGATAGDARIINRDDAEVVAAGPEALPRLDAADRALGRMAAPRTRLLDHHGAQTITDTPALRDHNYGNVVDSDSAVTARDDATTLLNPVHDYPTSSDMPHTAVASGDRGRVVASSSASDPTNFGGAETTSSLTAAVDEQTTTAWRPAPGTIAGEWLELQLPEAHNRFYLELTTQGSRARVQVESLNRTAGTSEIRTSTTVTVRANETRGVAIPVAQANAVRVTILSAYGDVGISEIRLRDGRTGEDITPRRVVTVPELGDTQTNRWVFGQEIPEGRMIRDFVVPQRPGGVASTLDGKTSVVVSTSDCEDSLDGTVVMDGVPATCGERIELAPGRHRVASGARWVALTASEPLYARAVQDAPAANVLPVADASAAGEGSAGAGATANSGEAAGSGGDAVVSGDRYVLAPSDKERIVFFPSDANPGRLGLLSSPDGQITLEPITVNGWQQGWVVPAGASGTFHTEFEAQGFYRGWLLCGGGLALALVIAWALTGLHGRRKAHTDANQGSDDDSDTGTTTRPATHRITTITHAGLATSCAVGTVWMARHPWGSPDYGGDSWVTATAFTVAVACVIVAQFSRGERESSEHSTRN